MAHYRLTIKQSAAKELEEIPKKDRRRIVRRIVALAADPRGPGCEKLSGGEKYRVRQGNFRILYTIDDETVCVCVVKIGDRKEVYR